VSNALASLPVGAPWAHWLLQGVATVAATWLVVTASRPLAGLFRQPAAWVGLLGVILVVGVWPGLPVAAVLAGAGGCGLIFASRAGELAALCLGGTWSHDVVGGSHETSRPRGGAARRARPRPGVERPTVDAPLRAAGRLAVVAVVLALPEAVAWLSPAPPTPSIVPGGRPDAGRPRGEVPRRPAVRRETRVK
jgi:hypothetical protein